MFVSGTPLISIFPEVGSYCLSNKAMSVDFPFPLSPTIATFSPGFMVKFTPLSTGSFPSG
jgi:hypothetical protein